MSIENNLLVDADFSIFKISEFFDLYLKTFIQFELRTLSFLRNWLKQKMIVTNGLFFVIFENFETRISAWLQLLINFCTE